MADHDLCEEGAAAFSDKCLEPMASHSSERSSVLARFVSASADIVLALMALSCRGVLTSKRAQLLTSATTSNPKLAVVGSDRAR